MYLSSVSSKLVLHDFNTWELKKTYGCYDGILRDISWSDDSKYLLQVNSKGIIEVLTPADHDVRSLQHIPLKDTWSAAFHRDGHRNIAIGTKSGNVMIWDTKMKTITKTFPTPSHPSSVDYISYNAKNTSLAATMQNGDTVIYGLVSNIPVLTIKLNYSKSISCMKFHHESRSLLGLATDEGHLVLRDITTNKDKVFFENVHASPVSDFAYSVVNKDVVLSCGLDKVMHVYDIRLQNVVTTIKTCMTLTSLGINSENQVALGSKNGCILIYDLRDLVEPLKVLKGHDEEVHRVSFQPIRKKSLSTEVSLREDMETQLTPVKLQSPTKKKRTSDMFFLNDTPPKLAFNVSAQATGDITADSFLVKMGLDKSNNDIDDEVNKSVEVERKSNRQEKCRYSDIEKNKVSTPILTSPTTDNLTLPSPIFISNGGSDGSHVHFEKPERDQAIDYAKIDNLNKSVEELKDFMKLTVSDVADDNKNYFLHIMMALTKQKLYLEKQLSTMNDQIHNLTESQKMLIEVNRKLLLENDKLKSQQRMY